MFGVWVEMSDWINVKDRPPDVDQEVFVIGLFGFDHNKSFGSGKITYKDDFNVYWTGGSRSLYNVTHWMPLPEPPK